MKVIDLLNKIANGEDFEKKHIKYFDRNYQEYDICMICEANIIYKLYLATMELNDEVEIIEDKKIEKIKMQGFSLFDVADKVNEIIDYINKGDKE